VATILQFDPQQLLLAGILIGIVLLGSAVLIGRKMPARWRWVWLIPIIAFAIVTVRVTKVLREEARLSQAIFSGLSSQPGFSVQDAEALRHLCTNDLRIQEKVLQLAFANPTNAALALPRLEFLLHATLQLDPDGTRRARLWERVVKPALERKPSPEVIVLAAATVTISGGGSNESIRVIEQLSPLITSETDPDLRAIALGVFAPLVEFAPLEISETAGGLLLTQLLTEENPMARNQYTGGFNASGSRCVQDTQRVVARLNGASAQRFADKLISALESQTNASRILALEKTLQTVRSELASNQVTRVITILRNRADPLIGLADVMSSQQAEQAINQLLAALSREHDTWRRKDLTKSFSALAQRLDDDALRRQAERMEEYSSDFVPAIINRIPQEQAYVWLDRVMQKIIETPNTAQRNWMIPRVAPLAVRLTPERASKLTDEAWEVFLKDLDESRWMHEVSFMTALAPRLTDHMTMASARRVIDTMKSQPGFRSWLLMQIITPLLDRCDDETVRDAANCVLSRISKSSNYFTMAGWLQPEFLLKARLTPEQMQRVIEPLVAEIESHEDLNPDHYREPVHRLAQLTSQLTPDQTERVGNRLVLFYTQRPGPLAIWSLNLLATNLNMTPYQAQRLLDLTLPEVINGNRPPTKEHFNCLAACARRLNPEQVEAACTNIIAAMGRKREFVGTTSDARALLVFVEYLKPDQARRLAEQLFQIRKQANLRALTDLGGRAEFPGWTLPSEFIARQNDERYLHRLTAWSQCLAALQAKMDATEARGFADQLAARCIEQGNFGPFPYEEHMAAALKYASDPSLTRILQTPFAVGGLRRTVLRAWELKTGKSLEGDFWLIIPSMTTTNAF